MTTGGTVPEILSVEVWSDQGVIHVRLGGELDLVSADDVRVRLVRLGGARVVVDLSGLASLDSAGLAALLVARRRVGDEGGRLELRTAGGPVRREFEVAGLDDVLDD